MLEQYFVKPETVDRIRASWLAPQIESYLEWLQAHGYSRLVVYRRLPLLFHFAEFAQKKGCRDIASCKAHIKEFVSQWLEPGTGLPLVEGQPTGDKAVVCEVRCADRRAGAADNIGVANAECGGDARKARCGWHRA